MIKRVIDQLGRVTLPSSMRKQLEIVSGETEIEITFASDAIIVRNPNHKPKKELTEAIGIIDKEIEAAKALNPQMAIGMLRIKELIAREIGGCTNE